MTNTSTRHTTSHWWSYYYTDRLDRSVCLSDLLACSTNTAAADTESDITVKVVKVG